MSYLIIPDEVERCCSPRACLLYAYILRLSCLGVAHATNGWYAKKLEVTTRTITDLINELETNKCIKVERKANNARVCTPLYIPGTAIIPGGPDEDKELDEKTRQILMDVYNRI